jgi:hypothetical protein
MSRLAIGCLTGLLLLGAVGLDDASAQRPHRVVVRRGPARRTTIVVRPGHPIRRVLPATVVVRPARRVVVVRRPLVWLPALAWAPVVVTLPARDHLVWEDSETIEKDEEWVDSNFGVDQRGEALLLEVDGKAKLNFAEVTFENGDVQVVDFNESTHDKGLYDLLDFKDGRRVMTVRLLARSETPETTFRVYLRT